MPLSDTARNSAVDAITALGNGGSLEIYTASFGTLLATFSLPSPFCGSSSSGTATANAISSVTAAASGNAESWRLKTSGGTVFWNRSDSAAISETGGGGVIIINAASTAITSGQTVSIASLTITIPAGT